GKYGGKGVGWVKVEGEGVKGRIGKLFDEEKECKVIEEVDGGEGDLLVLGGDEFEVVGA
ncbi:GAD domain-containing protein, partial [Bacillus subtilis]|uniref:GAD domain-containing protein n=1 Tax=Bacillus subtilis TaxID=1423 RepID=UPI0025776ACD